jgi:FkbM family methyltransferase
MLSTHPAAMPHPRRALQKLLRKLSGRRRFGQSSFDDMRVFIGRDERPVIFDVGANVGQSARHFRQTFPSSLIHSFEPSPKIFEVLVKNISRDKDIFPWNFAFGASQETKILFENRSSGLSSFLVLGEKGWGAVEQETPVSVTTIDHFLASNKIEHVHILKSDTQGYEFEVLKGAEAAIRDNRIDLIHLELLFLPMYQSLRPFYELFQHLSDLGFLLVSIYGIQHQRKLADWADALFVNRNFYSERFMTEH